jgi:hypothetical protein
MPSHVTSFPRSECGRCLDNAWVECGGCGRWYCGPCSRLDNDGVTACARCRPPPGHTTDGADP